MRRLRTALLAIAILVVACGPLAAAVAFVRGDFHQTVGGSNIALTPSVNPTSGNAAAIAIWIPDNGLTLNSVTGCATWSAGDHSDSGTGNGNLWLYYTTSLTGGACTITAAFGSAPSFGEIYYAEYSGTGALDFQNAPAFNLTCSSGTDGVTAGTGSASVTGDGLFAVVRGNNSTTLAAGTNYTKDQDQGAGGTEYRIFGSTGSVSPTFTLGTTVQCASGVIAFKPAAAGGAAPAPCLTTLLGVGRCGG